MFAAEPGVSGSAGVTVVSCSTPAMAYSCYSCMTWPSRDPEPVNAEAKTALVSKVWSCDTLAQGYDTILPAQTEDGQRLSDMQKRAQDTRIVIS